MVWVIDTANDPRLAASLWANIVAHFGFAATRSSPFLSFLDPVLKHFGQIAKKSVAFSNTNESHHYTSGSSLKHVSQNGHSRSSSVNIGFLISLPHFEHRNGSGKERSILVLYF